VFQLIVSEGDLQYFFFLELGDAPIEGDIMPLVIHVPLNPLESKPRGRASGSLFGTFTALKQKDDGLAGQEGPSSETEKPFFPYPQIL